VGENQENFRESIFCVEQNGSQENTGCYQDTDSPMMICYFLLGRWLKKKVHQMEVIITLLFPSFSPTAVQPRFCWQWSYFQCHWKPFYRKALKSLFVRMTKSVIRSFSINLGPDSVNIYAGA